MKPLCPHPMIPGVDKVPECDPILPLYCPTGEKGASEWKGLEKFAATISWKKAYEDSQKTSLQSFF